MALRLLLVKGSWLRLEVFSLSPHGELYGFIEHGLHRVLVLKEKYKGRVKKV